DVDLLRDLDPKLLQLGPREGQQLDLERLPGDLALERFGEAALDLGAHCRRVDQRGHEQDEQRSGERKRPEPEEDEFSQPWRLFGAGRCSAIGPWSYSSGEISQGR